MRYFGLLAGIALVCFAANSSSADVINSTASDNATVQPAGPRTGANGKAFLNIEGNNNGNFASYGVVDFTFTAPPAAYTQIDSISLQLTQSNAGFSLSGPLSFYLSTATNVDIQPGTSPLTYNPASTPVGVGSTLDTLYLLGSGTYNVVSTGTVDTFTLSVPNATAESYLLNLINTGAFARLVITPDADTTAATYGGATNNNAAFRPVLTINASAVPEPSTLAVLAISGVAALRFRNRNRKSNDESCANPA